MKVIGRLLCFMCVVCLGFTTLLAQLIWPGDTDRSFNPGSRLLVDGTAYTAARFGPDRLALGGDLAFYVGTNLVEGILLFSTNGVPTQPPVIEVLNLASGWRGTIRAMTVQPDGRLIIAGAFDRVNGVPRTNIARLNPDGSVDAGFNAVVTSTNPATQYKVGVYAVAIQPDGKILIGGWFDTVNGEPRLNLARLNPDGSLDTGFGSPSTGPNDTVFSILPMADSKVLIGGQFTAIGDDQRNCVARLLANGALDPSFGTDMELCTGVDACVFDIAPWGQNKILVAGRFDAVNGFTNKCLAVLNPDGSTDTNFVCEVSALPGEWPYGYVYTVLVDQDGGILLGGDFVTVNGLTRQNLARVLPDGSTDTSFQCDVEWAPVWKLLELDSARVCVVGGFATVGGYARPVIAAIARTGQVDLSFRHGRVGFAGTYPLEIRAVAELPDGKVLAAGAFNSIQDFSVSGVARLNSDGTVDTNFTCQLRGLSMWEPAQVRSLVLEPDGKTVVGGYFKVPNGAGSFMYGLAQLLPNGTVNTNFAAGLSGVVDDWDNPGWVHALLKQPDGKILIGGQFGKVHGVVRRNLARLNSDGTLDLTFSPSVGGPWEWVTSLGYQSSGRIIVAGYFTSVNGIPRTNLACLRLDGSVDPNFPTVPIYPSWDGLYAVAIQPDDKILIGGRFSRVYAREICAIARLLPNGELDTSFVAGGVYFDTGPGVVWALAVQPDGKILIGGSFNGVNGQPRTCLARMSPEGYLDSSFGQDLPGFQWRDGRGANVYAVLPVSNNRILVGGDFELANGVPMSCLAKVYSGFQQLGPITLGIERTPTNWVLLKWPTNFGQLQLMQAGELSGTNTVWWPVPGTPMVVGTNYVIAQPVITNRFFRLTGQ